MSKIVILESLGIPKEALERLEAPFIQQGHVFEHYSATKDVDLLTERLRDADAAILANMPLPGAAIRSAEKLRFLDVAFTGTDHVDLAAAKERGIRVSNASGYSDQAVAELAVGMILSLARNLRQAEDRCRNGGVKDGLVGWELGSKTVGILGCGRIGRRTGALLHAFGAKILAHNRTPHPELPDYIRQVSQEELLEKSDVVVLHCPLTPDTRGMIDRAALAQMKPTALLINVARGPVVVARDLAEALDQGVIAGAGIDVFDSEPPLPEWEPLLRCKNALLTPHMAFATEQSMARRAEIVFSNLEAWLAGGQENIVL